MEFLPKVMPDEDLNTLSNLLHVELEGYICSRDDQYYCRSCEMFETRELQPIIYHTVTYFCYVPSSSGPVWKSYFPSWTQLISQFALGQPARPAIPWDAEILKVCCARRKDSGGIANK